MKPPWKSLNCRHQRVSKLMNNTSRWWKNGTFRGTTEALHHFPCTFPCASLPFGFPGDGNKIYDKLVMVSKLFPWVLWALPANYRTLTGITGNPQLVASLSEVQEVRELWLTSQVEAVLWDWALKLWSAWISDTVWIKLWHTPSMSRMWENWFGGE